MTAQPIGITAVLNYLMAMPVKPRPTRPQAIDYVTAEVEWQGEMVMVDVEVLAVDSSCPNCEGRCEAGGPDSCPTCLNTGMAEVPRITLGRAWTVEGLFDVTLTKDDAAYVRQCYLRQLEREAR